MKMIKCDRCGKINDAMGPVFSAGFETVYFGSVTRYVLGEGPRIEKVDLCKKCNGKVNVWINEFMEKEKK